MKCLGCQRSKESRLFSLRLRLISFVSLISYLGEEQKESWTWLTFVVPSRFSRLIWTVDPPDVAGSSPLEGRLELLPKCRNLPMKPPPPGVAGVCGTLVSLSCSLDPGPPQPEKSSRVVPEADCLLAFMMKYSDSLLGRLFDISGVSIAVRGRGVGIP